MKILWLCNDPLPDAANFFNIPMYYGGGWMVSLSKDLSEINNINLTICSPSIKTKKILIKKIDNITHILLPKKYNNPTIYDKKSESYFKEVVSVIKPDIIHIHGTEYPHALALMKACPNEKYVVSIQGLVSIIAKHYYSGLPISTILNFTLRDILKNNNIYRQKKVFEKRGIFEKQVIKRAKYVIGRTEWDKACTQMINPKSIYCFCNENLRSEFYNNNWKLQNCKKHSIFISQGNYPIKGLHFILEALPEIIKKFPETHLYVGGTNIIKQSTLYDKIKASYYSKYIIKLIKKNNLEKYVTFTGPLNEKDMCKQFLDSHVFLSPSSIENSPNSLCEAMLLGVPCVASDVGGVKDILIHNKEGFIYPYDEEYMIAYYICKIFEDEGIANRISKNAREHAVNTHNKNKNIENLIKIYELVNESC